MSGKTSLKQFSVVGAVALPVRIAFPVFLRCEAAFQIRRGRPKALRWHAPAGETQFQPDETWQRRMRTAHSPAGFPKSAR